MIGRGGVTWLVIFGVALLLLAIGVSLLKPGPEITTANAAAVLALVTAGSVGIERVVESFWTIVGMTKLGNWWPLNPIGVRLDAFVDSLNKQLTPFYKAAAEATKEASSVSDEVKRGLKNGHEYLEKLDTHIEDLKQLEPGNPLARESAAGASQTVVGLKQLYPHLESYASEANRALAGVNEFVQTFQDNPARRLMSLYAGAVLGLIFAGVLGLDAIQAALGQKVLTGTQLGVYINEALPNLGTAVTGIVIGLGASPTHEVIKILQKTKERRKEEVQANR